MSLSRGFKVQKVREVRQSLGVLAGGREFLSISHVPDDRDRLHLDIPSCHDRLDGLWGSLSDRAISAASPAEIDAHCSSLWFLDSPSMLNCPFGPRAYQVSPLLLTCVASATARHPSGLLAFPRHQSGLPAFPRHDYDGRAGLDRAVSSNMGMSSSRDSLFLHDIVVSVIVPSICTWKMIFWINRSCPTHEPSL